MSEKLDIVALLTHEEFDPAKAERIAHRIHKLPIEIVPYDTAWPNHFLELRERIVSALGAVALVVAHAGSTSVPGLPAKPVIDIDVVVANVADEDSYVPALESVGFQFLLREVEWYEHRFFCGYEPISCNLHVWPASCVEVERHRIFREWLTGCAADRELYAQTKVGAAAESTKLGEGIQEYNKRKERVIRQILERAFRSLGYLPDLGVEELSPVQA